MEHSGYEIDTIQQQLAYCRGLQITLFVRVPAGQYHFIARALDAGALAQRLQAMRA
jgi:2-keto-3-deoxy-L-rhamnonate aldolase RhmA